MSAGVAAVNLLLGAVYVGYGTLLAFELRGNARTLGYSHLGTALLAMAFTCGPHHLVHGVHVLEGEGSPFALELVTAAVGVPLGAVWVALRIEAIRGGRGDRLVAGSPTWVLALPTLAGMYATAAVAGVLALGTPDAARLAAAAPNLLVSPIYALVAYHLVRTQLANRRPLGGWSVSGLTLAGTFFSCVVMHAVHAFAILAGRHAADAHIVAVDLAALPAAAYFLWSIEALQRGRLGDWNRVRAAAPAAVERATAPVAAPLGR